MLILGWQKTSVIDYPGHVTTIVFTGGCNFRCPYCHNPELVLPEKMSGLTRILEEEFFNWLVSRKGKVDAVEVTGGEPTLQNDLEIFIRKIKDMKFKVKLDSNGTNPGVLERLMKDELVDYVAMDIKAPLRRYSEIVGVDVDIGKIARSKELIMDMAKDYEFRTTVFPMLDIKDFKDIGEFIRGAKRYYLQQFRNKGTLSADSVVPYPGSKLLEFADIVRPYVKEVHIRGTYT